MSGLRERVARALSVAKGIGPDSLYQHNFEGDWPEDGRTEYKDAFTGEQRTMLFHRAWRHYEKAADAIIPLILAEAAKVARETVNEKYAHPEWNMACDAIAAAIEALNQ